MHHLKKVLKSVALQLKNDFQPTTDSHKPTFSTSIFHYGKQPLQLNSGCRHDDLFSVDCLISETILKHN